MTPEEILLTCGDFEIDIFGHIWRWTKTGGFKRAENKTKSGYLQVRKMINGKRYHVGAHRMVWVKNHGPIPNGITINHKNGKKDDNRPINIELATYSENLKHAFKTGLHDQSGERNPSAKLSDNQIKEIRLAYSRGGYTQKSLANQYGVSFQAISKIVRGDRRAKQPGEVADYSRRRKHGKSNRNKKGQFVGKKAAGRLLDGQKWNEFPEG